MLAHFDTTNNQNQKRAFFLCALLNNFLSLFSLFVGKKHHMSEKVLLCSSQYVK